MTTSAEDLIAAVGAMNELAAAYNANKAEIDAAIAAHRLVLNRPDDYWSPGGYFGAGGAGSFSSQGSHGVHLTSNGYRDAANVWKGLGAGGNTGATQIELKPDGRTIFRADADKPDGSEFAPTVRMELSAAGTLGLPSGVAVLGDAQCIFKRVLIAEGASYAFRSPGSAVFGVVVVDTGNAFPKVDESATFLADCGESPAFVPGLVSANTAVSFDTETVVDKINVDAPVSGQIRVTNMLATPRSVSLYLFGGEGS